MKKFLVVLVIQLVLIGGANFLTLQTQVIKILSNNPRNAGISVWLHYGHFIDPAVLTFDLQNLSARNSRLDIFRVFLQCAAQLKDNRFAKVELAYRGRVKFIIAGAYFTKLGKEYHLKNSVLTMQTFPENVTTPAGQVVFTPIPDELYSLAARLNQYKQFSDNWYLIDWASSNPETKEGYQ